jgi:hypothetical protein
MTPCIGIFGRIFGHKMEKFTLKRTGPDAVTVDRIMGTPLFNHPCDDKEDLLDAAAAFEYTVRCARCGQEPK